MKKTAKKPIKKNKSSCTMNQDMCKSSAIYGLGFVGALVYYISTATSFWVGVWGVIKAMLWPAFVVYNILKFFGM